VSLNPRLVVLDSETRALVTLNAYLDTYLNRRRTRVERFWPMAGTSRAAVSTALALWLLLSRDKSLPVRVIGVLVLILPHAVGAPVASISARCIFGIALGSIGGLLYGRSGFAEGDSAK
jgi:hypothetical protein